MKVKVCGLKDLENIGQILSLKPDFIGLNFYPKSERYFDQYLPDDLDFSATHKVGVFVNASFSDISEKIDQHGLNYIQLHGDEDLNFCRQIKKRRENIKIIKVFRINNQLPDFTEWDSLCDYYLFDNQSKNYGGSGEKFNWRLLLSGKHGKNYMLAGGIGYDDIGSLRELELEDRLFSVVDINSKFESSPGVKDTKLVEKFVREIRQ